LEDVITYELGLIYATSGSDAINTFNFCSEYNSIPKVIASILTFKGTTPAWIRTTSKSTTSYSFTIDQETCQTNQLPSHDKEWVAVLAFGKRGSS